MKKIFSWIYNNSLYLITLFLLAFIPLYPKKPLLDVQHTWVYVRAEDFVIALVAILWVVLLLRKKITFKTPLTFPILLFWITGGLATLHGVLLIFPTLSDVFPNVALLSFMRRIEYMFLFFVAYFAIKDKKSINYTIATILVVLLAVVGYGFGQKHLGFPAYLTMNEEFAKGVPIQLSQLSRVPSTFAGHYDLAAYLVLIIPILVSVAFGFKNWLIKIILLTSSVLGFALLFMTVSRVSLFVLLLSLILLLLFYKKKILLLSLFVLTIIFLVFSPSLLNRFGSTVTEIDVLVDAKTGESIGNVKFQSSEAFKNKAVVKQRFENNRATYGINEEIVDELIQASTSALIVHSQIPSTVFLLTETNTPTGEDLPQGTSYVNLHLSPIKEKTNQFFYQIKGKNDLPSEKVVAFSGDFLIKRTKAYDLSFTTRFQGEWPRTIDAFKRNVFLGSGYGSVSLAVDNNYLRILGESGLLGLLSFFSIFMVAGIYIKKLLPQVDSPVVKSFVFGFAAGTFGLALNAVLIDVFEASKIAFSYWLLMGITLGTLHLYNKGEVDIVSEFKKALGSSYAIVMYLFIATFALYTSLYSYYFVGDDFTWLKWAASCGSCNPVQTVLGYFTQSDGFFYRPGTKIYFYLMYSTFWLNQTMYHLVSLILHFSFAALLFLVAKRVFKDHLLAAFSAFLFLILSGHSENVLWISSVGYLFNAVFAFLGLLSFIYWRERKKDFYLIGSVICIAFSMLFHEVGVIVPLLIILYDIVFVEKTYTRVFKNSSHWLLLFPVLPYLFLRFISASHWFSGDYSYNLLKLPFNFIGNAIGYFMIALFGPMTNSFYQILRIFSRDHLLFALLFSILIIFTIVAIYQKVLRKMASDEQRVVIFSFLFFVISLLPFLGLGNITPRYNYLSSVGVVIVSVFLLKKTYEFLSTVNGRIISFASVVIIAIFIFSVHLFQLQKMHKDWHAAGERAERFLISLNSIHSDGWTKEKVDLYFVDVPIKYGDAWIFPVGLRDALWFVYRNEKIRVYNVGSSEEAFSLISSPSESKVFEFNNNGGLVEMIKTQSGEIERLHKE